jgi:DNA-binding NarL/FixJ family response regulator
MKVFRVLLADDHPALRAGIAGILAAAPDIAVVGEAGSGQEAMQLAEALEPDVILLDVDLPDMNGIAVAQQVRARSQRVAILGLSAHADLSLVQGMLAAGAAGYLTKDEPPARICAAVRSVAAGETGWFSRSVGAVLIGVQQSAVREAQAGTTGLAYLTAREREVLALLAQGLPNSDIAARAGITPGTLKNHVRNMLGKLRLHSRSALIAWAWRQGMGER